MEMDVWAGHGSSSLIMIMCLWRKQLEFDKKFLTTALLKWCFDVFILFTNTQVLIVLLANVRTISAAYLDMYWIHNLYKAMEIIWLHYAPISGDPKGTFLFQISFLHVFSTWIFTCCGCGCVVIAMCMPQGVAKSRKGQAGWNVR